MRTDHQGRTYCDQGIRRMRHARTRGTKKFEDGKPLVHVKAALTRGYVRNTAIVSHVRCDQAEHRRSTPNEWIKTMNSLTILQTIVTGDFLGYAATGVEEDHPVIVWALALHTLLFG